MTSDQYSAVFAEFESLPKSDSATIKKERVEILGPLRSLKLASFKKYREKQKETLNWFLDKASWQSQIEKEYLAESTGCKVPTCPHSKCTGSLEKPEDRDFHLHDVHCSEPWKPKSGVERRRSYQEMKKNGESEEQPRKRRQSNTLQPWTFEFAEQNSLFGESNFPLAPALTLLP